MNFSCFPLSSCCRMASKVIIIAVLILVDLLSQRIRSLAAPAGEENFGMESLGSTNSLMKGSQYPVSLSRSNLGRPQTAITQADDVETLLSSSTTITPANALFSFSYSQSHTFTQTSSTLYAKTVTVTEEIPTTTTVSANPVTVTEIFFPTTPIPTSNSPSRTSTAGGPAKSIWLAPKNLSDLSAFHVSKFTGGKGNLEFVNSVQAEVKMVSSDDRDKNARPSSSTLLQILFPKGSINPGTKPQGGAEFYASPIDITPARNVTLQYKVFFPLGFDFVLGGKMPGLYGGHTGCSGGDPAVDCFSTRLMWREGGIGELYLYAPKERQSDKLCKAKGSVCDELYGFSIGRGSFSWKAGGWTTITQTVFLNTPGKQDGIFTLDVDGKRAIIRHDILYRDAVRGAGQGQGNGKTAKQKTTPAKHTKTKKKPKTAKPTSSSDDGDLLGIAPLLSGLIGGLRREIDPGERNHDGRITSPNITTVFDAPATDSPSSPSPELGIGIPLPKRTQIPEQDLLSRVDFELESTAGEDVKFVGIFFSTFFGGHDDKYATPRDQYVWFKEFALAYNS